MNRTTAIKAIKHVSNIDEHVVNKLYDMANVQQPQYVDIERRAHPRTRCDNTNITHEDVVHNATMYSMYSKDYPEYIVEDVQLTPYITVQYTYTVQHNNQ